MAMLTNLCASSGFGTGLPGGWELILVLAIILVIFGPKRLPALSRSIGKSITDFKKGLNDIKGDIEAAGQESEETSTDAAPKAKVAKKEIAKKEVADTSKED